MKGKIERLQGDSWSAGVFAPENPAAQPLPLIVMNLSDPAGLEPLLPELKRKMGKEMRPAYLAALYMAYESPEFGLVGCLSGSLWYEGFMPWAESRRLASPDARVYLSLGRKEEKTRNPYLCKIGDCYRREEELLTRQLGASRVTMTWHDGGHATEVPRRMLLGLETLLKTPAL